MSNITSSRAWERDIEETVSQENLCWWKGKICFHSCLYMGFNTIYTGGAWMLLKASPLLIFI